MNLHRCNPRSCFQQRPSSVPAGLGGVAVVERCSHEPLEGIESFRHFCHDRVIVREGSTEALDLVGTIEALAHAYVYPAQ